METGEGYHEMLTVVKENTKVMTQVSETLDKVNTTLETTAKDIKTHITMRIVFASGILSLIFSGGIVIAGLLK